MPRNHVAFAEKENRLSSQRQVKPKDAASSQAVKEKAAREAVREFPSTPAGRVPLADLIGNNEENLDNSPRKSPLEAVSWDQVPRSSDISCITPVMRRGKKRARSISPSSSQKALAAKSLFDPNVIFKTPQNDPATDLENRYFARSKHQTPSKPSSSAAPDFMHSSSPVTPVLASGESAKLRRTVSCGVAWPSGNKRRRLCADVTEEPRRSPTIGLTAIDKQGELQKINMLLDSIHDGLPGSSKSSVSSSLPSSCPLPNDEEAERDPMPLPAIQLSQPPEQPQEHLSQDNHLSLSQHREPLKERGSSVFEDGDVEEALAGDVEPGVLHPVQSYGDGLLEQSIEGASEDKADNLGVSLHLSQSTKQKLSLNQDFDDNDDDFDDFAADLELVASMYDEQPTNPDNDLAGAQTEAQNVQPAITLAFEPEPEHQYSQTSRSAAPVLDISSDEEFGDDDFEEIANEIERATQAGEDLSTVRLPSQRT